MTLAQPCRVLFVCTGNICRSPLAEAILRSLAEQAGVGQRFEVDSAGTHDWHQGERADPRTRRVAERHGVKVTSLARAVAAEDFERFDVIVAMDRGHLRWLRAQHPAAAHASVRMLRDEAGDIEVPDPYYGGDEAFERTYTILEPCCRALLEELSR